MNSLVLTGFMASGKSTVGQILAQRFGMTFIDTDSEVERSTGCTVANIFERHGEAEFRRIEARVFQEAIEVPDAVIATGGGTLLSSENRGLLTSHHFVVCLECDLGSTLRRAAGTVERPLLNDRSTAGLEALLGARQAVYSSYPRIDTTNRSPDEVADAIAEMHHFDLAASYSVAHEEPFHVLVAAGSAARLGARLREYGLTGNALLVTDSTVAALDALEVVTGSLRAAGLTMHTHVVPAGEAHKTLETVHEMYTAAAGFGLDRHATVIGLGGGVVCDMAGFLASTYLRGLALVLVPTTLLAQVDASIGGKVGVDFQGTKNLIGAFKPARIVAIDPTLLRTLPHDTLLDGLVEVIKIGFILSSQLVADLRSIPPDCILDHPHVIRKAAAEKVGVVQRDPLEHGERMLLNFGHTIGHGLEAASDFTLSHGRAVSIGMVAETRLAVDRGWCDRTVLDDLLAMLKRFSLPVDLPAARVDRVVHHIARDKKRKNDTLRVAVPTSVGTGTVVEISIGEIEQIFDTTRAAV